MSCVREATAGAIEEAAARLRSGDLVAFPTETVYGIGASTLDAVALAKVYAIKERPQDNPLIAHVLDAASARRIVASWPETAERLAERFWPGPLTLVLARGADLPEIATVWRPTIAVRAPAHPVARDLLAAFGGPVSAPSANRSGHVSPTTASHVAADFPDADLLILDGGTCPAGIESTVLDLTEAVPRLLRPGGVTSEMLADALNTSIDATPVTGQAFTSWSEKHDAQHIVEILNQYFELMVEAIFKNQGTLDKFMGDGIMALFGAPIGSDHDAFNAVNCAVEMMDMLRVFNASLAARGLEQMHIGVGINTGPVVVGYMGSSNSMEYTAIGDQVNLSARLCGVAEAGQVLVSQSTLDAVGGAFETVRLPAVSVKGIKEPVAVHQVLARIEPGSGPTRRADTGVTKTPF